MSQFLHTSKRRMQAATVGGALGAPLTHPHQRTQLAAFQAIGLTHPAPLADPFPSIPLVAICDSTAADTARALEEAAALSGLPLRGAPVQ